MKNIKTTKKATSVLFSSLITSGCLAALSAAPAMAASCNDSTVQFWGLSGTVYDYASCEGAFSGNDTGAQATLEGDLDGGLFGDFGDWSLAGKSDDGNNLFNADNGLTSGDWGFDTGLVINGPFALSFKASNSYSVFFFDDIGEAITGGFFTTDGVSTNGRGNAQALSHASLWVNESTTIGPVSPTPPAPPVIPTPPAPPVIPTPPVSADVPEPASLAGLALVAAALGFSKRKQA